MKAKHFLGLFAVLLTIALGMMTAATPENGLYPSTNTVTYGTNSVQLLDSTATGLGANLEKGTFTVLTRWNSGTATVAFVEPISQTLYWKGLVRKVKITGIGTTDVAKVASLTATPFK